MRYRKLDANGDYSFGRGLADFWIDVPDAVAQAVGTVLQLWQGQWFLDTSVGVPWAQQVVGTLPQDVRDAVVQTAIAGTQGVAINGILSYASQQDPSTRVFSVQAEVTTIYSKMPVPLTTSLPLSP